MGPLFYRWGKFKATSLGDWLQSCKELGKAFFKNVYTSKHVHQNYTHTTPGAYVHVWASHPQKDLCAQIIGVYSVPQTPGASSMSSASRLGGKSCRCFSN